MIGSSSHCGYPIAILTAPIIAQLKPFVYILDRALQSSDDTVVFFLSFVLLAIRQWNSVFSYLLFCSSRIFLEENWFIARGHSSRTIAIDGIGKTDLKNLDFTRQKHQVWVLWEDEKISRIIFSESDESKLSQSLFWDFVQQ